MKCAPNEPLFLFKLGDRMAEAKGIPRDCARAGNLFYKSMSLGYSKAGGNLGYLYDKGCGTILRDDKRAFQIYLACAKAGDAMCQNNVGAMLKHGRGVGEPDYVRSFAWFIIAASGGEELARKNLENYRDLFPSDTREQGIKHAKEVAEMIHPGYVDMQALERLAHAMPGLSSPGKNNGAIQLATPRDRFVCSDIAGNLRCRKIGS